MLNITTNAEALFQSALQHHQAGRLTQAEALARQILAQQPGHAAAWHLLAVLASQVGRPDMAVELLQRAIAIDPTHAGYHSNLGRLLLDQGQLDGAIAAFRQALVCQPDFPEACNNLGVAHSKKGELDQAVACYRRAIALAPNSTDAYNNLGAILKEQGQLDEALACYDRALAINPALAGTHSNKLFALHFHPAIDARAIYQEHRRWNQIHAAPLGLPPHTRGAHGNERSPERPLRIGYLSPDFRDHPVGRFLLPLLAAHDHEQCNIYCYYAMTGSDSVTERLAAAADQWRNIAGLTDAAAAQTIAADGIDILVDLAMHTAGNRLLIFARKPAPVQITYLAYCSTTGLDAMDYRLSDPYLDPPGGDQTLYAEQTVRLPETYWCYQPSIPTPAVGPLPMLSAGHITFGSLNNFNKLKPTTLAVWCRLLQAVGQSRLLLYAHEGSHRQWVRDLLAQAGVDPQRVDFVARTPTTEYFQWYHRIDIALDPFPYGGGTTICDALWMGVPVISLAGQTAVSRGGLSILSNAGLPELVAANAAQYVTIASDLATNTARLADLRRTLRERLTPSPLMDAPRFARHIEAAYRGMWRNWCRNAAGCAQ